MAPQLDTAQQRAAKALDRVKAELPDVWLGGRQRMVLELVITDALQQTRRDAFAEAVRVVPSNWCNPLLQVIKKSPCPEIEALLNGIRNALDRLREGVEHV